MGLIYSLLTTLIISFSLLHFVIGQTSDFYAGKEPGGIPLEQLAREYWIWSIKEVPWNYAKDIQTNLDECLIGFDKTNVVAFLNDPYDTTYTTKCTISSDKYLLVPLLIGECDPTVPEISTKSGNIEDLWACAAAADEPFETWEVVLDDNAIFKQVGNDKVNVHLKEEILVRNSSLFDLYFPEGNRYDVPEGTVKAVVDGYYLPLNPLSPGEHKLEVKLLYDPVVAGPFKKPIVGSVTYFLTVTE